jgi:hypothetical protein
MQPRISLCLIAKNEEANLPACLQSARDLVDEIIVVDTGSRKGRKRGRKRVGKVERVGKEDAAHFNVLK